ncbi:uncharacterized protein [Montipora foliosa]|uniref:uncharacterized protein n=1 Tax=Montipora foliosa TaxID=591990 RepID=UPI0035F1950E
MDFILFYAMIVTVSLGYPAVSPAVLRPTSYELSSYKRRHCDQTNVNTLIQIQCDSNSENNTCKATCDGNGNDTTVTRLSLFSRNSENGERQVCIESFNGHILTVSDSDQVIFQPLQGRSCHDTGMVFPFLLSQKYDNDELLFSFKHNSTKMMLKEPERRKENE